MGCSKVIPINSNAALIVAANPAISGARAWKDSSCKERAQCHQ